MKRNVRNEKRGLIWGALMVIFCVSLFGCGKKGAEAEQEGSICRDDDHTGYTAEGMVYQDYAAGLVKYLDYKTGECYPLCARPNCLHDSEECAARALCGQIQFMGRLGDKWYYFEQGETEETFHSCGLDGGNDQVIGTYPYETSQEEGIWSFGMETAWGNVVFEDGCCFVASSVDNYEEDPNNPGSFSGSRSTSNLYRYHLDTGEREVLCPEKTMRIPCYTLWGIYENQLIYSELLSDEEMVSGLRKLDLETKEISDLGLTAEETLYPGCVNGRLLLYNEPGAGLTEFDLETGEKRAICEDYASNIVWEEDLKAFLVSDTSGPEPEFWVYQYTEEGECKLLYEDKMFIPSAAVGDLVMGQSVESPQSEWRKSVIKKEDFLAGKTNWTVIVEERES